ncbi:hypothetical protein CHLRE_12g551050v5 [Chlamydomonas reinhardtii]|uniref:Nucleoplasmin-like domain-containing protein n=1 Tax=Chlamydomonas reinhardtii TaxID=3055 RepID=A0A2K3D658_CHLRE|nr:uncharacterized protein CHLRE_12g551050v5 [Chlamydomonas reinhardtii]PNW76015.1 hypothetical protein CHLRE_12g551050v5 [Chlamydomonas reinhardtii]
MAFWSIVLPGKGKEVDQEVESSETVLSSIHVTGLALGTAAAKGPHVVSIEYNGTVTVLATLEAPHTRQVKLDIALDQTFKLANHGDAAVYAYGYQVATSNHIEDMSADGEDEDEDEDEDFDEGEDEDEDDDDEEAPEAVPLANGGKGKQLRRQRREADEEDEEEDEDDEDDGIPDYKDLNPDDLVAENQGEDEDEDEDGEGGEDEDDGEDDDAEMPTAEEEEEEEEEEDTPPRLPAKAGSKRPAPAQTPQPAKAQRGGGQPKPEPKSAPPKSQQAGPRQQQQQAGPRQIPVTTPAAAAKGGKETKGTATPGNEAEFRQALVALLKSQRGPVPLAQLGHAVQRPVGMKGRDFKLGSFLEQHSELFEVDPKKGVSLKKGGGGKK